MLGRVQHVHVAARAGAPMVAMPEARAERGRGLRGDRYADGGGYWQDGCVSRDLTLVAAEVLDDLAAAGEAVQPGELRRNVTTRGLDLNALAGSTFWVGDALCRGMQLCEPCRHLEELTGRRLLRPLVHRGGLRADILTGGTIRVGDAILAAPERPGVGVVVAREGAVLLGRRLSPHGHGTWSLPGGKPEPGESPVDCAIRELREETALEADAGHVVGETVDGFPRSRDVFRTLFVEVSDARGEPARREPDKVEGWQWFRWDALPEPLFAPLASLVRAGYVPS
jgi:ADP-ribose pyrophosphatase YjhB (NUDIX family)